MCQTKQGIWHLEAKNVEKKEKGGRRSSRVLAKFMASQHLSPTHDKDKTWKCVRQTFPGQFKMKAEKET